MGRPKGLPKTGGKKKGSKNKKTIEQEMALELLRKKIRENWDDLINTKLELAKGIWAQKIIGKGIVKVYKEKPDSNSLEYLFSMVVGKPKENLDITSKGEKIKGFDYIQPKKDATKNNTNNKTG